MNFLVTYSDSDKEDEEPLPKLPKLATSLAKSLPKATELLGTKATKDSGNDSDDLDNDKPENHGGRIRSFKHERGNWATHVHIPADPNLLDDVQEALQIACEDIVRLHATENPHISLSRTVVLQYHQIDAFVKTLENNIETIPRFPISFRQLRIYTNDERTRTFIAFSIEPVYHDKMRRLLTKVDAAMKEFKLPQFYEDPSFHVSILWCLGDQLDILNSHMQHMMCAIATAIGEDNATFRMDIRDVQCKSGNKEFQFKLR